MSIVAHGIAALHGYTRTRTLDCIDMLSVTSLYSAVKPFWNVLVYSLNDLTENLSLHQISTLPRSQTFNELELSTNKSCSKCITPGIN